MSVQNDSNGEEEDHKAVQPSTPDEEIVGELVMTARAANSPSGLGYQRIKFMDDEVVMFKNIGYKNVSHGFEDRETWDEQVQSGYWKYANEQKAKEVEYAAKNGGPVEDMQDNVKGLGNSGIESLKERDYKTVNDVIAIQDDELSNIPGIGSTTVERIREEYGYPDGFEENPSPETDPIDVSNIESQATEKEEKEKPKEVSESSEKEEEVQEEKDDSDKGWDDLLDADDDWIQRGMEGNTELDKESPFNTERAICAIFGHKWGEVGMFNKKLCNRCRRREKVLYEVIAEWS